MSKAGYPPTFAHSMLGMRPDDREDKTLYVKLVDLPEKRKASKSWLNANWFPITNDHIEHLKWRYNRYTSTAQERNLLRYLLGTYNKYKAYKEALEHISRHFGSAEQCREIANRALNNEFRS